MNRQETQSNQSNQGRSWAPGLVLETERLILRRLALDDAPFILALLNEPSFIQNIGDKGVRTLDDARAYLSNGPLASYERYGFGLSAVESRETGEVMGICGLIKRDSLDDVDLGFAFLPAYWGQGYAVEAAAAVKRYGRERFGLQRIVAITIPSNHGSIRVLEKVGFRFEKMVRLTEDGEELRLYSD